MDYLNLREYLSNKKDAGLRFCRRVHYLSYQRLDACIPHHVLFPIAILN